MYQIIKQSEWHCSEWAGGETNQLFIYPADGDYTTRNFLARISIATTNSEGISKFTALPGVDRFISTLEGSMHLEHEEHYSIDVKPYEIDRFQGSWLTFSTGKYRDFNLMLQGVMGDLYFKEIKGDLTLHLQNELTFGFIYVIEGEMTVNDTLRLEATDLLISKNYMVDVKTKGAKVFYGFVKEWNPKS